MSCSLNRTGGQLVKIRSVALMIVLALGVLAAIGLAGCSSQEEPWPKNIPTYKPLVTKSQITAVRDVVYGSNTAIDGNTRVLKMDIYYPPGGLRQQYPLVILLHGGGFSSGSNKSQWKNQAPELATYGFVVACPNYRVGDAAGPKSSTIDTLIVQGMQDSKAAVRFFRQDIAQGNQYHIDPKRIFLGGFSAGAIVTGQAVYLDNLSKADTEMRNVIVALGGLEGNSGHPGYDSSVTAWINMAGALIDPKYITANSKPMINIYGTEDITVDPGDGYLLWTNCKGSGGRSLSKRAESVDLDRCARFPINKGGHVSPFEDHWEQSLARIVAFIHTFD